MPWVTFNRAFDWKPHAGVTVAYKAGGPILVTTPCAERAITKGAAVKAKAPKKAKATRVSDMAATTPDADAATDGS